MTAAPTLPAGLTVLERGWLSSNNILLHAGPDDDGAVLVDTGHVNHAAQTLQLLGRALGAQPLARIVNTHLHSDHCGGNAAVQQAFGAPISIPAGGSEAVIAWNEDQLSYRATGQTCPRFTVAGTFAAGDTLQAGGRAWHVLHAPGHDPDSVMLFEPDHGVLISADALWENGFGIVFPELAGEPGFDDIADVLDAIERLPVRSVIPGHGAPFTDVATALVRARSRLAGFRSDPARHARHALKVLTKYHLMEVRQEPLDAVQRWALSAPLVTSLRELFPPLFAGDWCERAVSELVASGALALRDGVVHDV